MKGVKPLNIKYDSEIAIREDIRKSKLTKYVKLG